MSSGPILRFFLNSLPFSGESHSSPSVPSLPSIRLEEITVEPDPHLPILFPARSFRFGVRCIHNPTFIDF